MFRQFLKSLLVVLALAAVLPVTAVAATLEITGPPGASLVINDQDMGFFPLDGPLDLPGGVYTIKSRLAGHQDYEYTIKLVGDGAWQRVSVRLVPFSRKTAWTSNILFAGLGQHYLGKSTRGWIYNIAEAGGLLVALFAELDRNNLSKDYLELQDNYNSTINADDIARYREEADQAYSDMKDKEDMRNAGLMVAGGAIVVSILDAIIFFPSVEAGAGPVPMDTGSLDVGPWMDPNPLSTVHLAVRLEF
ncbi:MAG: hypothetical protein KAH56_08235 [Candidatus Krumholzibacteria bacterium]|nr:hypothetical protein [Candidatus Krumholzibacteria bacterium]